MLCRCLSAGLTRLAWAEFRQVGQPVRVVGFLLEEHGVEKCPQLCMKGAHPVFIIDRRAHIGSCQLLELSFEQSRYPIHSGWRSTNGFIVSSTGRSQASLTASRCVIRISAPEGTGTAWSMSNRLPVGMIVPSSTQIPTSDARITGAGRFQLANPKELSARWRSALD